MQNFIKLSAAVRELSTVC